VSRAARERKDQRALRERRERDRAHFLNTLKKGMVAEEKRWTLLRVRVSGERKVKSLMSLQDGLELALEVVSENQAESDPERGREVSGVLLLRWRSRYTYFCIFECSKSLR
jgi:hypothetical protein